MKVLAIADFVKNSKEIENEILIKNPDVIFLLGDLDFFSLEILNKYPNIPKFGVYGNHCREDYFEQLNVKNIHLKKGQIDNFNLLGFNGCFKTKESRHHYTENQAAEINDFSDVQIVLTHCPPKGINDNPLERSHQGFESFLTFLKENKPKFWLHGHTYPKQEQKISRFDDSIIIYVHGVEFFDLNQIKIESLPFSKSY